MSPTARSGAGFCRVRSARSTTSRRTTSAVTRPACRAQNFERNLELVDRVSAIAEEKGVTSGQLALAWVLHQGEDIVPIPGTKRRSYLEENVATTELELSPDELERIDEAAPSGAASGDRYPDMSTVDR